MHELLFETLENHVMGAAYTVKGDSFVADKPRMWSDQQVSGVDLAPDGKRIGGAAADAPKQGPRGTRVANRTTELRAGS